MYEAPRRATWVFKPRHFLAGGFGIELKLFLGIHCDNMALFLLWVRRVLIYPE